MHRTPLKPSSHMRHMHHRTSLEESDSEEESLPGLKKVSAKEDESTLGVKLDGLPPGYVTVTSIDEGSWGQHVGLEIGDGLIRLNGMDLLEMLAVDFKYHLTARPLRAHFMEAAKFQKWLAEQQGKPMLHAESEDEELMEDAAAKAASRHRRRSSAQEQEDRLRDERQGAERDGELPPEDVLETGEPEEEEQDDDEEEEEEGPEEEEEEGQEEEEEEGQEEEEEERPEEEEEEGQEKEEEEGQEEEEEEGQEEEEEEDGYKEEEEDGYNESINDDEEVLAIEASSEGRQDSATQTTNWTQPDAVALSSNHGRLQQLGRSRLQSVVVASVLDSAGSSLTTLPAKVDANELKLGEVLDMQRELRHEQAQVLELRKQLLVTPELRLQWLQADIETSEAALAELEKTYSEQATFAASHAKLASTARSHRQLATLEAAGREDAVRALQEGMEEAKTLAKLRCDWMHKAQQVAEFQWMQLKPGHHRPQHVAPSQHLESVEEVAALMAELDWEDARRKELHQGLGDEDIVVRNLRRRWYDEEAMAHVLKQRLEEESERAAKLLADAETCEQLRSSLWSELPESMLNGLSMQTVGEAAERLELYQLNKLLTAEQTAAAGAERRARNLQGIRAELTSEQNEVSRLRDRLRFDSSSRREQAHLDMETSASQQDLRAARLAKMRRELRNIGQSNRHLTWEIEEEKRSSSASEALYEAEAEVRKLQGEVQDMQRPKRVIRVRRASVPSESH